MEFNVDERDKIVADKILNGECPFGCLEPNKTMSQCPIGFPGCNCMDEMAYNPFLKKHYLETLASYMEEYDRN
jgi:hypothetical protein